MAVGKPREIDRPGAHTWRARLGRAAIIAVATAFAACLLVVPLCAVFAQALAKGWEAYFEAFGSSDTHAAIRLTLITALIVVPLNTIFGIAAAYAIARFEFRGKSVLTTLIELPFAVSPVISGLVYVLLFGAQGWFGSGCRSTTFPSCSRCPGSSSPRCS